MAQSQATVPVETPLIQLAGGLDLASTATLIRPGFCLDATNYEIDSVNGGYQRINGYERFDGRSSPSAAAYWQIGFSGTAPAVGATITGSISGSTGKVLYVGADFLILGRVTGSFVVGDVFGGATATTGATQNGALNATDNATFIGISADDLRADIQAVPGSGAVLGVHMYKDNLYAWRNNAGGTAAVMHKATVSGWSAVTMYKEIAFTTGLVKPAEGAVLFGGTSSATGTVKRVVTRTGTWGSNAQGYIVIDVTSGTFQSGEALKLTNGAGAVQATSSSVANTISFQPGGRYECVTYNFTGSTDTSRMYGVNGVGPAFEFDGTTLALIITGMTADTPTHIAAHKNYLFLSFKGSVQNSGIGDPYSWSLLTGSSEIGVGDEITNLLPQPGDANTGAMAIFTKQSTRTLYGDTASTWKLSVASPTAGAEAYTAQHMGTAYAMSTRGVQQITETLNFGDFMFAAVSGLIQPMINAKLGKSVASAVYKTRNQYRVFFNDKTALAMTANGNKVVGFMPIQYAHQVSCYYSGNKIDGSEVAFFGDSDGYVYQDNVGTSFDGQAIESWLRLPFSHFGSPRYRKRFRRLICDMSVPGYTELRMSYEIDGGSAEVDPGVAQYVTSYGSGGYWDQFTWEQFTWDTEVVVAPSLTLDGTGKNISVLFYGNSAICGQHTIGAVTFHLTLRRLER